MPQKTAQVSYFYVAASEAGQRLDNYLMARLKGLPRSRVYRIIRSGEVRVNKGRAKAAQRLEEGDAIRVPPVRLAEDAPAPTIPPYVLEQIRQAVLYRDDDLLALNKPAGLAVHAGSGVRYGLIDVARELWGDDWQLVHRLDRETSGCLLLVRRRELQQEFQQALASNAVNKQYLALVHGQWPAHRTRVESWLARGEGVSGERRVQAQSEGDGQRAVSHFALEQSLNGASLLKVTIETGRTHQIRVQAAESGHPLIGDSKYGRRALDAALGLKSPNLCLHAQKLELRLGGRDLRLQAKPPETFLTVQKALEHGA